MQSTHGTRTGRLILVRHGESEGNRDRIFTQTPAVPLTDRGRQQARDAAELIRLQCTARLVVASPYARARETAEIIAVALGLTPEIDEDFREQSLGELAGRPYDTVAADPSFNPARRWEWRPRGGESLDDVRRRVAPAFDRLAAKHPAQDVVLVSHGGVMFALWAHVVGAWESAQPSGNAGILIIEHHGSRYEAPKFLDAGGTGRDAATLVNG